MASDSELTLNIKARNQATKALQEVSRDVEEMSTGSKRHLLDLSGAFNTLKLGLVAFAGSAAGLVGFGTKIAGDFESAEIGFRTILGSAEAASAVMARIKKEAAATPFELKGLTDATQALAIVTKEGDKSVDILLNVGKALSAAGKGQAELDRIIANLQQIGLTGKITEMDVRQFGMNGVNILELLADQYGVTTEKAGEMVKDSKDAFGDLEKAFAKAGGAGGKFEKSFANQAGSFNQLVSNMKDNFTIFATEFVKQTGIFDGAKQSISSLVGFMSANQQTLIDFALGAKEVSMQVLDFATQLYQYLSPSLTALYNTLNESVIPALSRLWHEAIEPMLPVIAVLFVGALKAVIDIVNGLLNALTPLINFMASNPPVVYALVTAFVALKAAILMDKAINATIIAFNTFTLITLPSLQASLATTQAALAGFTGFAIVGAAAAAAVVQVVRMFQALQDVKRLANEVNAQQDVHGAGTTAFYESLKKGVAQGNFTQEEANRRMRDYNANFQSFTGKAIGGPVGQGQPYVVGERGPEVFIPNQSGKIVPNGQTDGMMGGNITIHIANVTNNSAEAVDRFFDWANRDSKLTSMGVTGVRG